MSYIFAESEESTRKWADMSVKRDFSISERMYSWNINIYLKIQIYFIIGWRLFFTKDTMRVYWVDCPPQN